MWRILKTILIIISGVLFLSDALAQDSLESKLGHYLVAIKELDSVIYKIEISDNQKSIISNFYVERLLSIEPKNNGVILFYKFGAYIEDKRPHFVLIKNNNLQNIKFINYKRIEDGITTILENLSFDDECKELELFKIRVLKYYINSFPD